MTCKELIDFLSDYTDGTLPPTERMAFDMHLAICRDCRNYLDSFKQTLKLSKLVAEEECVRMPESLVKAILASSKPSPTKPS